MELISDKIKKRIKENKGNYLANDSIAEYIEEGELDLLQEEVEQKFQSLLDSLVINYKEDHNTKNTAHRVAKMYLSEVFKGRYHPIPNITEFPNAQNLDEIYTLGPITLRSTCSHHFVPIIGDVTIGILPDKKLLGISKFVRLIDHIASMPHIQEEFAIILANKIEELIAPKGLGIIIDAQHYCMKWRGVKEINTTMKNSVMRGVFRDDPAVKQEFLNLIRK